MNANPRSDRRSAAPTSRCAVLVDVDGTLAGKYRGACRPLRPGALQALQRLAEAARVYLWSAAGPDNPKRLLQEYPKLRRYVSGTYGKTAFPIDRFRRVYCIDDEELDDAVLACERVIVSTYDAGSEDDGLLVRAAELVVDAIVSRPLPEGAR